MEIYSKKFVNDLEDLLSDLVTIQETNNTRLVMFDLGGSRELHFYRKSGEDKYIVLENNIKLTASS